MNRRSLMGSILAAATAPYVVRAQSLMPVRSLGSLILPGDEDYWGELVRHLMRGGGHGDYVYDAITDYDVLMIGQHMRATMERNAYIVLRGHL